MPHKQTRVDIAGKELTLKIAEGHLEKAIKCLRTNGEIKFRYSEVRVRDFPGNMSFEPRVTTKDGGDGDSDSDSDSDGGGWDID